MQQYELLSIVPTQFTDEEVGDIGKKISALVEKVGGKVVSTTNLGKIRMAYTIKKVRHGSYVLTYFDADGEVIAELDRQLRLTDEVLRHTILDRPADADPTTFELTSYVAPLTEEAKKTPHKKPRAEQTSKAAPAEIAPPTPSSTSTDELKMSMEELDQKLDQILEGDIAENI
ncbi:30S ribosomal protein S6 [Candidatus Uhrbacteria bacterium CG_4_9_14_3_um_filter_50_9]|uniref:Small ribosomal subunit protein bS6 n=1 Tax=Candidatus Uhrbacteria bacterium CG_4_9_14_3_um_filter_50_9 TaxID=1975035 RepID=A0A2M7XCQ2_9BACT|nr:MAG: 30S ribosomal protein S6 [Candidatus Uhrbacteria bacterium CG_4_9_14_3_um_filter_50_9]